MKIKLNKLNMRSIRMATTKVMGKNGAILKKNSPEILLFGGLACLAVGTVLACKETMQLDEIIQEGLDDTAEYEDYKDDNETTKLDDRKQSIKICARTAHKLAKNYAPAIAVDVIGVSSILTSHKIMVSRNLATAAVAKAVSDEFKAYRSRTADKYGDKIENDIYHAVTTDETVMESIGKDGKVKKTTKKEKVMGDEYSIYAKFFSSDNPNWSKSAEYNKMFLQTTQNYCNDLLRRNKVVFLNEVYDAIGLERTQAGSVVGWALGNGGDDVIDFGIFEADEAGVRFVNGYEPTILMDFNVDGLVYNLIWNRDGLSAIGSGVFAQDVLDYPDLYSYIW